MRRTTVSRTLCLHSFPAIPQVVGPRPAFLLVRFNMAPCHRAFLFSSKIHTLYISIGNSQFCSSITITENLEVTLKQFQNIHTHNYARFESRIFKAWWWPFRAKTFKNVWRYFYKREFRLPPRCRWKLCSSGSLRSEWWQILPTFPGNLSVPSSGFKNLKTWGWDR